jgi:hypothetical protein
MFSDNEKRVLTAKFTFLDLVYSRDWQLETEQTPFSSLT